MSQEAGRSPKARRGLCFRLSPGGCRRVPPRHIIQPLVAHGAAAHLSASAPGSGHWRIPDFTSIHPAAPAQLSCLPHLLHGCAGCSWSPGPGPSRVHLVPWVPTTCAHRSRGPPQPSVGLFIRARVGFSRLRFRSCQMHIRVRRLGCVTSGSYERARMRASGLSIASCLVWWWEMPCARNAPRTDPSSSPCCSVPRTEGPSHADMLHILPAFLPDLLLERWSRRFPAALALDSS